MTDTQWPTYADGSPVVVDDLEFDDNPPEPFEPEPIAEPFTVGRDEFLEVRNAGGADAARTHLGELLAEHGTIRVSDAVLDRDLLPREASVTDVDEHGSVYVTLPAKKKRTRR